MLSTDVKILALLRSLLSSNPNHTSENSYDHTGIIGANESFFSGCWNRDTILNLPYKIMQGWIQDKILNMLYKIQHKPRCDQKSLMAARYRLTMSSQRHYDRWRFFRGLHSRTLKAARKHFEFWLPWQLRSVAEREYKCERQRSMTVRSRGLRWH